MNLANVNLLVAAMDLKLVRLIRGAMRNADAASARSNSREPAATYEPRRVVHPEPRYEARRVIRPEPRYEARPVKPLYNACADVATAGSTTEASASPRVAPVAVDPPWKTLAWKKTAGAGRVVKVIKYRPDRSGSGSILDCFL